MRDVSVFYNVDDDQTLAGEPNQSTSWPGTKSLCRPCPGCGPARELAGVLNRELTGIVDGELAGVINSSPTSLMGSSPMWSGRG
jgi:hypothetical protein